MHTSIIGNNYSRVSEVETSPVCVKGTFVIVEPDYSACQNQEGGEALVLKVHGFGVKSTYDVQYTIRKRVENDVPASRITSLEIHGDSVRHAQLSQLYIAPNNPRGEQPLRPGRWCSIQGRGPWWERMAAGVPKRRMAVPVANSGGCLA